MRVVSVCGTRGSGKTTLIRELVGILGAQERRAGIIVNEDGEEDYPRELLESCRVHIARIRGG